MDSAPAQALARAFRLEQFRDYLALEAGLPIVPLSIVGSRHVMLKGRLATYPGDVTLVVHEPIETTSMSGADAKTFGERVRQLIKPAAESDCGSVADDLHARA